MQRTGAAEHHAREMIAIETGASGRHVVLADKCPPDLVPFFCPHHRRARPLAVLLGTVAEELGGEYLGGWRPMLARQLYDSDVPTG
jgi:hypothetical protein